MKKLILMLTAMLVTVAGCESGILNGSAGADRSAKATNQNAKASSYQGLPLNEKGEYQNPGTDK